MKKLLLFTTLSAITVIMATPALALQFENEKDAEAHFAEEARIWQKIRENMEKGKTDSDALGKAIDIIFDLHLMGTMDNPVLYTQKHMKEIEISQEQQIKTLERMTRERLTAIEKDEKINTTVHVVHLLPMLGAMPRPALARRKVPYTAFPVHHDKRLAYWLPKLVV